LGTHGSHSEIGEDSDHVTVYCERTSSESVDYDHGEYHGHDLTASKDDGDLERIVITR
jgi:hypothetical protein